jgi:hypothetical protein
MSRTLEELEGESWGEPEYGSHLVTTIHRLRKKPLDEFTIEDLRIVLGQTFSAEHLMPLALDALERDPLAEGDFYPGDLFVSVTRQPEPFWRAHPELERRATAVAERLAVLLRKTWAARKKKAQHLYGASLDDESASHKDERQLVNLAERFASAHQSSKRTAASGPDT